MAEFTQISDLFRAAADLEAETPITVGATTVGPDGRVFIPQGGNSNEWRVWADRFPIKDMRRLKFSVPTGMSNTDAILEFFGVATPERLHSALRPASIAARQSQ